MKPALKPLRFAFGALALAMAMSAVAVPSTSYNFSNPTATTGATNFVNSLAGYNANGGTNWGNSLTFAANGGGSPVVVTGWASTGNGGGYGGQIQSAFVSRYSPNEIAVTSRSPQSGGTSTNTTPANTPAPNAEISNGQPNSGNSQHAMDSVGAYESLMFSFQSAVTLADVAVGFPSSTSSLDSDATVLVYTGSGTPPSFSARTFADLVAPGGGWQIASNPLNLATLGHGAVTTSLASKYWMVGAYMNIGSNVGSNITTGNDYMKVSGLTVTPRVVPEPGSLALFGIASLALLARRRRIVRAD